MGVLRWDGVGVDVCVRCGSGCRCGCEVWWWFGCGNEWDAGVNVGLFDGVVAVGIGN